jgi:hypothetical protein
MPTPHPRAGRAGPAVATAIAAAVVLAGVLGAPATAAADPARPGGTLAVIEDVTPAAPGLRIEVSGGDTFLVVTADPGTEVEIPGYDGEPYLRILADGTVQQNRRSPSAVLNENRDGTVNDGLGSSDGDAAPQWEDVGDGGTVAWHDHRIHWMLPEDPVAAPGGTISDFEVPLLVDRAEVSVTGRLVLVPTGVPWAIPLAAACGVVVAVLGRSGPLRRALLAVASLVAGAVGASALLENPPGAGARPWGVLLAAGALACALGAALGARRAGRGPAARALELAAVALLCGWWVGRVAVLWASVVPTLAPGWTDRAGTALVAGISLGAAVAVLREAGARPVPMGTTPPVRS